MPNLTPKILFRASLAEENELEEAKRHFAVIESRTQAHRGDLIIGRYSVLPYYDELQKDLALVGASLINSHAQHRYIADLQNWYWDFEDLTPKTWFRPEDIPHDHPGSFVLKGATNSRKQLWNTHMFAKTRADVMTVYSRLLDDSLLSTQGIYIREFEPFVSFGEGLNGIPISEEYRFFFLDGNRVGDGFYWSEHYEDLADKIPDDVPSDFISEVTKRVGKNAAFYVVDIARHQDGRWRVVELNDGQMSGLSCVKPEHLYYNLTVALEMH